MTRKKRSDAIENRQIILQKSSQLFEEHGVANVSMRDIASAAGIGPGTLYRHYAHKGELCLILLQEGCTTNLKKINSYLVRNADLAIRERLENVVAYFLDYIEDNFQLLVAVETSTPKADNSSTFHTPHYQDVHAIIYNLLIEVMKSSNSLLQDITFRTDTIMNSCSADFYLFLRRERGYSPLEIKQKIYNIYLDPLF